MMRKLVSQSRSLCQYHGRQTEWSYLRRYGGGGGIVFRNHKISTKNLSNAFCFSFQIPKFQKI